jgi:hypothetical protein
MGVCDYACIPYSGKLWRALNLMKINGYLLVLAKFTFGDLNASP